MKMKKIGPAEGGSPKFFYVDPSLPTLCIAGKLLVFTSENWKHGDRSNQRSDACDDNDSCAINRRLSAD